MSERFEDFCDKSLISDRVCVKSFKLDINRDNWRLWGIVEQRICGNYFFRRIAGNDTFPRCPIPLYAQSPAAKVSVVQGVLSTFGSIPLIKVDYTVAYSLMLDLGVG